MFFAYWAQSNGYHTLLLKAHHEVIAIALMSSAVAIFLTRVLCYRMEIDYILTAMSVNFLCREIHFKGTNNAVVIVAGLVLIWVLLRRKHIWASIENAKLFQISLTGTAFTYFFSILIARRVFSADHIPILPDEALIYDRLEEVMENIAHMFLVFTGIVSFYSLARKPQNLKNSKSK